MPEPTDQPAPCPACGCTYPGAPDHELTDYARLLERLLGVLCPDWDSQLVEWVTPTRLHRDLLARLASRARSVPLEDVIATLGFDPADFEQGAATTDPAGKRIEADDSWKGISDAAASYPLHLDAGEDGEPLARGRLRGVGGLPESGDDSALNFDD